MFKNATRTLAAALVGAIALTAVSVTPADARRRGYNAAGAAAFAAVLGTIATVIIAEQRRKQWEDYNRQRYYGYGGYPPPQPYYYGRPYYRPY